MAQKSGRYYLARLNCVTTPFRSIQEKHNFLLLGVSGDEVYSSGEHSWGFSPPIILSTGYGEFVYGNLIKYRPEAEEEVFDEETHQVTEEPVPNRVTSKAPFYLHIRSGFLAFQSNSRIDRKAFPKYFKVLFEQAHGNFMAEIEIDTIGQRLAILSEIPKFQKITSVRVVLHPSNPSHRIDWAEQDAKLKRVGADTYIEEYKVTKDGHSLNLKKDEDLEAKLLMAEDGYGEGRITGMRDGEERTVSTSDNPISIVARDTSETPENILMQLYEPIIQYFLTFEQ